MMKNITAVLILLTLVQSAAFSGDVATFVNLGFSENSEYFLFGQHGLEDLTARPYAGLYLVNVRQNDFVPNGIVEQNFNAAVNTGQNTQGALLNIFTGSSGTISEFNIDHLMQGRTLYLRVGRGEEPVVSFRDFTQSVSYSVMLAQNATSRSGTIGASFHINITITDSVGSITDYTVGRPDLWRSGVLSYRINRILLSPDGSSLIFVVEKIMSSDTPGNNIRFMVETLRFR